MNFEKPPVGGGARGRIRNSPKWARLSFHFRPINRGKGALQAAGNFTIDYLSPVSQVQSEKYIFLCIK